MSWKREVLNLQSRIRTLETAAEAIGVCGFCDGPIRSASRYPSHQSPYCIRCFATPVPLMMKDRRLKPRLTASQTLKEQK